MTGRLLNAEFDRFVEAGVMVLVSARDANDKPVVLNVDPHVLAHKLLAVLQDMAGMEFTEFGDIGVTPSADLLHLAKPYDVKLDDQAFERGVESIVASVSLAVNSAGLLRGIEIDPGIIAGAIMAVIQQRFSDIRFATPRAMAPQLAQAA